MSIAVALLAIAFADAAVPLPLNDKVVEYARAQLGRKVGDGECSALAAEALRHAGARSRGPAWGRELPSIRDARPGDILQFTNATFIRTRLLPDGSLATLTFTYGHHTAIVSGVRKRGRNVVLSVLHQNAGATGDDDRSRKVVQEWGLNMAEMRGGTLRAYRPAED